VRSGIAGAVLFSFQLPPLPKDASKLLQVPRRYLVQKAQAYRRSMVDLLADISARDDRDWGIRLITIPGWINYMKETVDSCIQGEIAQASIAGEEMDERTAVEKVTSNLLKQLLTKMEETPKMSENASIAIACLGLSLPAFAYDQIEKITDILKSLLEKGENEWIKYGSTIALGLISLALQSTDTSRIQDLTSLLIRNFTENDSEWVKFGCGVALGTLASGLYKQTAEQSSQNAPATPNDFKKTLLFTIVNTLLSKIQETQKVSGSTETKWSFLGASLGLGWASHSLEMAGERKSITDIFESMNKLIKSANPQENSDSGNLLGALLTLPTLAARSFRLETLNSSGLGELVQSFQKLLEGSVKSNIHGTICIGYATLVHAALAEGFVFSPEQLRDISENIVKIARNAEDVNTRSSGIIAIANLLGSWLVSPSSKVGFNSPLNSSNIASNVFNDSKLFPIVEKCLGSLKSSFETDADPKACRLAAWILGSLSRPLPPATFSTGTPTSLNHLPESSIIRALFTVLQNALVSPAIPHQLASALACLSQTTRLPSVRWESLLLSLMKAEFGTNLKKQIIKFSLSNTGDSAILGLLNDWAEPSRFSTFESEIQRELFQALPQLLSIFPSARSRKLVADLVPIVFDSGAENQLFTFNVLASCLGETNIPSPVISEIHILVLDDLPSKIPSPFDRNKTRFDPQVCQLLAALANCLKFVPKDLVSAKIQLGNFTEVSSAMKFAYLNCILVQIGFLPHNSLQQCRTWCLSQVQVPGIQASLMLMPHVTSVLSKVKETSDKTKWILDTFDSLPMCPSPSLGLHFLTFLSFAWNASDCEVLFGHKDTNFMGKTDFKLEDLQIYAPASLLSYAFPKLTLLPAILDKVMDRMNMLLSSSKVPVIHSYLANLVLEIRHSSEFVQSGVWNRLVFALQSK